METGHHGARLYDDEKHHKAGLAERARRRNAKIACACSLLLMLPLASLFLAIRGAFQDPVPETMIKLETPARPHHQCDACTHHCIVRKEVLDCRVLRVACTVDPKGQCSANTGDGCHACAAEGPFLWNGSLSTVCEAVHPRCTRGHL
jgi:hypothetical protein